MSELPRLVLITPPSQWAAARLLAGEIAHMSYRVGEGLLLTRMAMPAAQQGGLMYLSGGETPLRGDGGALCRQILRECSARGFSGVIADWETSPTAEAVLLTRRLDETLAGRGLSLYVPEEFARCAVHSRIMVPSALSGGSLRARLEDAAVRYSPQRTVLAVMRMAEDFTLPAPSGRGQPLTASQLEQLRSSLCPAVYWSSELCARYFTYQRSGDEVHFVLFDDGASIRCKLQLAAELGIERAILSWQECGGFLSDIVGQRQA